MVNPALFILLVIETPFLFVASHFSASADIAWKFGCRAAWRELIG